MSWKPSKREQRIIESVSRYHTATAEQIDAEWRDTAAAAKAAGCRSVADALRWMRETTGQRNRAYYRERLAPHFS